jgi:hypothetical protein
MADALDGVWGQLDRVVQKFANKAGGNSPAQNHGGLAPVRAVPIQA